MCCASWWPRRNYPYMEGSTPNPSAITGANGNGANLSSASIEAILGRIDTVRSDNRGIERLYLGLTVLLFGCGTACFVGALVTGQYLWASPSALTTGLLYWPLREIKDIRRKNIALATAPILITQLPPEKAAREIQKLLQVLYEERTNDAS